MLSQADLDLIISLTPSFGDPDVYISLTQPFPNKKNFTWSQTAFGPDTLTIQSIDILQHGCNPKLSGFCTFYLGVYGFLNSSFSMVVHTNEGFTSPLTLLEQHPQSGSVSTGEYTYYRYIISSTNRLTTSIKLTITPLDDGDQDLYIMFGQLNAAGNPVNASHYEPGRSHYDYKSTNWASSTDQIEVSNGMAHFCRQCVLYVAVYGYKGGHYILQASSQGVLSLVQNQAIGGRVDLKTYVYYSFFNAVQFAQISISLTMVSGDADLYVSTTQLPTEESYVWRSSNFGNDVKVILYDDPQYCWNCEYFVGVYGYKNSTFTLLVSTTSSSVVKLKPNSPQLIAVSALQIKYFTALLASSAADTTVTITEMNSGSADLFVQLFNASSFTSAAGGDQFVLPDPSDPSTYRYTTRHSQNNHVYIPATHRMEELLLAIAVYATTDVQCSIVVTDSQAPVLLQLGTPQNHFVELGRMVQFVVYPDDLEDLRVTVTARSGDPDLLISGDPKRVPHCGIGAYSWQVVCGNYTWSSRQFSTDQIILSQDSPCSSVLASTLVDASCDPANSYDPSSHKPVYIGVYGYKAAKFSILVAAVGQQIHLLAGQPQLSTTSAGFLCSQRSPVTGACLKVLEPTQVSYFSFRVSASPQGRRLAVGDSLSSVADVIVSVVPVCNESLPVETFNSGNDSWRHCLPGCACNPLVLAVSSCPISKCDPGKRRPSWLPGQHQAVLAAISARSGSSLIISSADEGGAYCDPTEEDCLYFLSVATTTKPLWQESATFSVAARTPGDLALIPCDSQVYPDGIKAASLDLIAASGALSAPGQHFYELCGQPEEDLVVELEQCHGRTALLACPDDNSCSAVVPTLASWAYFSDDARTCSHSFSRGRDTCTPTASNANPSVRLPRRAGNYLVTASGAGLFTLRVMEMDRNGHSKAPKLVLTGLQTASGAQVTASQVTASSVVLTLRQSRVFLPGARSPSPADLLRYRAVLLPQLAANGTAKMNTPCGLEYLLANAEGAAVVPLVPPPDQTGEDFLTVSVSGLRADSALWVVVLAECDGACLLQLSKRLNSQVCSGSSQCQTQSLVYWPLLVMTPAAPDSPSSEDEGTQPGGGEGGGSSGVVLVVLAILAACIAVLVAAFLYWRRHDLPLPDLLAWIGTSPAQKVFEDSQHSAAEMVDLDHSTHSQRASINALPSSGGDGYSSGNHTTQATSLGGWLKNWMGNVSQQPQKLFGEITVKKKDSKGYSMTRVDEEIDFR